MQRYFVDPSAWRDNHITITGDDVHHIVRVMRGQTGDHLLISDSNGRLAKVELTALDAKQVDARVVDMLPLVAEPKSPIWVAQALPKADKMELIVQKGTEIGVGAFLPFTSARTIVQYDAKKQGKVVERWSKIAKEAAEQAHRDVLPVLHAPQSWKQMLARIPETAATFICYEKQLGEGLRKTLEQVADDGRPVMVIVGPEGGFTEQEITQAVEAGAIAITLGARILRTETAALVAASGILFARGEMGG